LQFCGEKSVHNQVSKLRHRWTRITKNYGSKPESKPRPRPFCHQYRWRQDSKPAQRQRLWLNRKFQRNPSRNIRIPAKSPRRSQVSAAKFRP